MATDRFTREALRLMRGIINEHQHKLGDAGVSARVDLLVRSGVRRYWLTFEHAGFRRYWPTSEHTGFISSPIMLDATDGVVWIRKALHEHPSPIDNAARRTVREIMEWVRYETLILDYLLENFDPLPGSENVLSLKAARRQR